MPRNTPSPRCLIDDSLPCTSVGARTTLPPKAWPIAWWPRQTPRIGIVGDALAITSRQMPASFGVHGPGDSTIASGCGRDHIGGRDLVVAMHDDVRPQPAEVVEQVEGEAVVIVDQDDHGFRARSRS